MLTAALFTIARIWKLPKCPSVDEWIKKMWRVCVCVCVCVWLSNMFMTIYQIVF